MVPSRRHGRIVGTALFVLFATALTWAAIAQETAVDTGELYHHVADLRSQAAEAELLESMPGRFSATVLMRVHALQLGHRVDATRGDLDTLHPDPRLLAQTARARVLSSRLAEDVRRLALSHGASAVPVRLSAQDAPLLPALQALERELRP